MGTDFTIRIFTSDAEKADVLFESAFAEIERIEQLLSTYRPTSDLSRINRNASTGRVVMDFEMTELLDTVLSWSQRTDGAFDPTVGALMAAWGFRGSRDRPPTQAELTDARERTGYSKVNLVASDRTISFAVDGLWIDSGAFGKGYALDRAASILERNGIQRALLDAGQSTYVALDPAPGELGWPITITDSEIDGLVLATTYLSRAALSTSGQSHKSVRVDGKILSHILDPRSGFPIVGRNSMTVVARDGLEADILSTATFVMGIEEGTTFIESMIDVRGFMVSGHGPSRTTTRIRW